MSGEFSVVERFNNVTNEARLLQTKRPDEVGHIAGGIELRWFTPKQAHHIRETIDRFNKQRPIKAKPGIMGKLHEAALRIAAKKKELDSEADKILAKLDGLDAKSPGVFAAAQGVISAQNADIDAMDSELRQLSNMAST